MEWNTRGLRVKRSANQRQELLSRFSGSGLSVTGFSERERISDTSYHRWRGRLGLAGGGTTR